MIGPQAPRYPLDTTAPAFAVEWSAADKLSPPDGIGMSATYAGQRTCPASCPLLGAGCYGESGHVALITRRLNRARVEADAIARVEADAIGCLSGRRHLRVHVVGDCRTARGAALVGAAMVAHTAKHGRRAWTYTHAWRDIPRRAWRGAQAIASCERLADVRAAWRKGYAAAIIVPAWPAEHRVYKLRGVRVVPCPASFRDAAGQRRAYCEDCAVCAEAAPGGYVVGFEPHGTGAAIVRRYVERVNA